MRDNDDKGGGFGRALIPGIGLGAALTLIHMDMAVWGLVIFLVTIAVLAVKNPKMFSIEGAEATVQRTLSSADYTRSQLTAPLIVPGVTMLASFALEPADLDPMFAAPLLFLAMAGTSTWAFLRIQTQARRVGGRRMRAALEKAPFETATATRVRAVSTGLGRGVVRGLRTVGAVDGIQVRLWRLAEVAGRDVSEVHRTCRELEKLDVVRLSGVDAGGDVSRTLAELTPVGVRAVREARSR